MAGLQPLTTESVVKIRYFVHSSSVIVFSTSKIIVLSSAKQNIQYTFKTLEEDKHPRVDKHLCSPHIKAINVYYLPSTQQLACRKILLHFIDYAFGTFC